jgi:hypothetical protein
LLLLRLLRLLLRLLRLLLRLLLPVLLRRLRSAGALPLLLLCGGGGAGES